MTALRHRWEETWRLLGRPAPEGLLEDLLRRWGERHRHYHSAEHLAYVLERAEGCRELQEWPAEVELALWFHDAVHRPRRRDNEEQSAELARRALGGAGLERETMERVATLILDTRHDRPPTTRDGEVVVDVDLAILGADPETYDRYAAGVRREHRWILAPLYRRGRAEVLRGFLERASIFRTPSFRDRYEAAARDNLRRELAVLQ